jgi:serine/threonine protein kinase
LVEIGRGGFGVVYRAIEHDLERPVAVKVLFGTLDESSRRRFERERRAMGKVSGHPHVVTVYRTGLTDAGQPFIVMELMEGGSMQDRLKRDGTVPWAEAVRIGRDIGSALEVAHGAGILHRDVKPGNLLMSSHGVVKLADFGIAFISGSPETKSGVVTASLAHAAPEVLAGKRPDVHADVYSLGSTLYELMRGTSAFVRDGEDSLVPMLARIAQDTPPSLAGIGVPPAVCEVVEHAMAKDPADRPASAAELTHDLARVRAPANPPDMPPARPAAPPTTVFGPGMLTPPPIPTRPPERPSSGRPPAADHTPPRPQPAGPGNAPSPRPATPRPQPAIHGSPPGSRPPGAPFQDLAPQSKPRRSAGRKLLLAVVGVLAAVGFVLGVLLIIGLLLPDETEVADPDNPSEASGSEPLGTDDVSALLGSAVSDPTATESSTVDTSGIADYDEYVTLSDDDEIVTADFPAEWSNVTTQSGHIVAAEPGTEFFGSYDGSGAAITVSQLADADPDQVLDDSVEADCASVERTDYDDGFYVGRADAWVGCGSDGITSIVHVAAVPEGNNDVLVFASVQLTQERDFLAAQRFYDSFIVDSSAL